MGLFDTNKTYKVRTGARSTSKVQQRELVKKAKKIGEDPDLVLPKCRGKCFLCPIKKVSKRVRKISGYRNNLKKLKRLAKRGNKIARAYAGTLTLTHPEVTPFMRLFKSPFGQIPFAVVGRTDPKKLIGIQHYDHKEYRLMAYLDLAERKKIHIYSMEDGMVCTGSKPSPPEGFVEEAVRHLDVDLRSGKTEKKVYASHNLEPSKIEKGAQTRIPYLKILWHSPDTLLGIDEIALRDKTTHTVGKLAALIAGPDVKADFSVEVVFKPECHTENGHCIFSDIDETDEKLYEEYMEYKLTDHTLVTKQYENIFEGYGSSEEDLFLFNGHCFSKDLDAFFEYVKPKKPLDTALKAVLKRVGSPKLYRKKTSPLLILSDHWEDYGFWALRSVCGDKEIAGGLHSENEKADATDIPDLLDEARKLRRSQKVLESFPKYDEKTLPEEVRIANRAVRIFKGRGERGTIDYLLHLNPNSSQSRSLIYAFLLGLGATSGNVWKFEEEQRDVGEFLKPFAEDLLEAEPEDYNEALQTLSRYTGSTLDIEPL